ncbi:hypothetical protein SDC9_86341 [bioreactor metagenome]|uniref:Lipoprotein n=1 Tax=bioreactor metagenome TaxID=1076179 RepID=A0A644ZG64_9ZZZZ|nr:hypothetical protein [Romboutsia lituseburensis]
MKFLLRLNKKNISVIAILCIGITTTGCTMGKITSIDDYKKKTNLEINDKAHEHDDKYIYDTCDGAGNTDPKKTNISLEVDKESKEIKELTLISGLHKDEYKKFKEESKIALKYINAIAPKESIKSVEKVLKEYDEYIDFEINGVKNSKDEKKYSKYSQEFYDGKAEYTFKDKESGVSVEVKDAFGILEIKASKK